ncbi:MAG: addiction module toxin, HicA family, partial [Planctomycetaceae bacterium]|nr:addiction module toxin, HicA family [Planctomycetaceae bacterium]
MPEIPRITGVEAVKAFQKAGFSVIRIKGSHHIMKKQRPAFGLRMLFSESTGRDKLRASLGGHKEVNRCLIVGRKERSLCGCNWT